MNMKANCKIKLGVAGHFKMIAHKMNDLGEIISSRVVADFDNNIPDQGLDFLGAPNGSGTNYVINGCVVGSGNTAESNSDTHLASFVAGTNATNGTASTYTAQTAATPYYTECIGYFRFATGVAAGNLAEVGCTSGGPSSTPVSSTPIFSRALIKDGSGNPTVITILSDETLDVVYSLRFYVAAADATGTFNMTIDGTVTAFNYTVRPVGLSNIANSGYGTGAALIPNLAPIKGTNLRESALTNGGVTAQPLSTALTYPSGLIMWPSISNSTYVNGNHYVQLTGSLGLNDANINIKTLTFNVGPLSFQIQLDTPVAKVNTKTFTFTMQVNWDRYSP